MNIQQALRKQSEIHSKISALEDRVRKDFLVYNQKPLYDLDKFTSMIKEVDGLRKQALDLKLKIDVANHIVRNGDSVASLLAKRLSVVARISFSESLKNMQEDRYMHRFDRDKEPMLVERRISEATLDATIDALVTERQEIDDKICELNATIQVVA